MRILYLSISYVPSRRASSVHVMKMCAALAAHGHEVTLVTKQTRDRMEGGVSNDFSFYGVKPLFDIVKLPRPRWKGGGLVFLYHVRKLLRSRIEKTGLVYSRDLAAAALAARLRLPVIFEAHGPPTGRLAVALFRSLTSSPSFVRLVVISKALKRLYEGRSLLPSGLDVIVAHDAADCPTKRPSDSDGIQLGRRASSVTHVGYVGHLYSGRGIETLASLARSLDSFDFHIVGGSRADLARWSGREVPSNLIFHGFVHPGDLNRYYDEFDILIAPYQLSVRAASGGNITAWMSPMKIFEYMAAAKPIVASDLPVLREVLHHRRNAILVEPDDISEWQRALEDLVEHPDLARRLAQRAESDFLSSYTWDRRAELVVDGL